MGTDKLAVQVCGLTIFDRVIDACSDATRTIAVGPRRGSSDAVWVVEDPPGSGPAAALSAGLDEVEEEVTVVLAADLPLIDRGAIGTLVSACEGDGAIFVDEQRRDQYLAGAYRTGALRDRFESVDTLADRPMHSVVGGLDLVRIAGGMVARDVDTEEDLEDVLRVLRSAR